jgi:putative sterol carrier protein
MSLDAVTAAIRAKAATLPPLGYRVLFELGSDGAVFWDGSGPAPSIDNTAREADTTITIALADLAKLIDGTLDPTLAYMTGRLKVQGSLGVALKINQYFEG